LPEQENFLRSALGGFFYFAQDQICGDRDLVASSVWDDAVGAFFIAADRDVDVAFIWRASKLAKCVFALVVVDVG